MMPDINILAKRIDAEFTAVQNKIKKFQSEQAEVYQQRQKRLEQLKQTFDQMSKLWKPRLELLMKRFGDHVQVTPRIVPSAREAVFDFQSQLAKVRLKFSASTDRDIRKLILAYDLEIIPVLIRFQPHDEIEFSLDAIDLEAAAQWVDDRIVDFIRTYFSLGENDLYLKDHLVEDPVAHVQFPRVAAAATMEHAGQTYYFISEETRHQFENSMAGK